MVPFQPSEYKEDNHFLRQHVGVKEPRGVQVDTQTAQKDSCGAGTHQFLQGRERSPEHGCVN